MIRVLLGLFLIGELQSVLNAARENTLRGVSNASLVNQGRTHSRVLLHVDRARLDLGQKERGRPCVKGVRSGNIAIREEVMGKKAASLVQSTPTVYLLRGVGTQGMEQSRKGVNSVAQDISLPKMENSSSRELRNVIFVHPDRKRDLSRLLLIRKAPTIWMLCVWTVDPAHIGVALARQKGT